MKPALTIAVWTCLAACGSADKDYALPDSPLYDFAVREAIQGLKTRGTPAQQGEVCPGCGKIHPPAGVDRAGGANTAAHNQGSAAAAEGPLFALPCPDCGKVHPPGQADAIHAQQRAAADSVATPPPGRENEYYYCENCRVYHHRQPTLDLPLKIHPNAIPQTTPVPVPVPVPNPVPTPVPNPVPVPVPPAKLPGVVP